MSSHHVKACIWNLSRGLTQTMLSWFKWAQSRKRENMTVVRTTKAQTSLSIRAV